MDSTSHQLSDAFDELNVGAGDGEPLIEGPWIEPSDNPTLNDVVLGSLFNYIDGNDLKTCRLVCRKWTVLTTPFTRSRLRVTIWGTDSNHSEQSRGIVNFVKLIESNTLGIPFGRFRLGSFDTRTGPGQRFLELCGKTAKAFWLDCSADHVVENVSALLKSAPKLESFVMPMDMRSRGGDVVQLFPGQGDKPKLNFLKSLDVSREYPEKRPEICPTFYEEFLGTAQQISTLSLSTFKIGLPGEDVFAILETLGKATEIENLKIANVTAKDLKILERIAKESKLKKLDLTVIRGVEGLDWFEVVKLYKNKLTCLHMDVMTCNSISLTFPSMPNLKQLKLELPHSRVVQSLSCENQNFSTTFPVLEKFHIFSFGLVQNLFNGFTTSEEPLKTMKSLIVQQNMAEGIVGMETLNHILSIFPNLTTFESKICYDDGAQVIQKIWSHMTQLEELKISCLLPSSVNLDSLVTGLPDKNLKSMAEVIERLEDKTTTMVCRQEIISAQPIPSRPSIQNLTALRSLNIRLAGEGGTNYLTALTGYLGFYPLKNLRHLSVFKSDIFKTCSEILVKDKELMSWKFKSATDKEVIPPNPKSDYRF